MEGINQLPVLGKFTIPKKKPKIDSTGNAPEANQTPRAQFKPINETNPDYEKMSNIITRRISGQSNRNYFQIRGIAEIENMFLRNKHEQYKRALQGRGKPPREFFVFLPYGSRSEMEDIVKNGLKLSNSFYSDLGMNSKGVYVFKHPDLMVAHPFYRGEVVKGICFKFAALTSNYYKVLQLDASNLPPQMQHPGHFASFDSSNTQKNRLEKHKADQLYLYDTVNESSSDAPACLLPYFIFDLEVAMKNEIPVQLQEHIRSEIQENLLFQWRPSDGIFGGDLLSLTAFCSSAKPYGVVPVDVRFENYLTLTAFHEHPIIEKLFQKEHWGKMSDTAFPEVQLREEHESKECWHVLLTILRSDSKRFKELLQKLKKQNLGISYSCSVVENSNENNPVDIICLCPGETTMRLGLPYIQGEEYMYCFIAKYGGVSLLDKPMKNEETETDKYSKVTEDAVAPTPGFNAIIAQEYIEIADKEAEPIIAAQESVPGKHASELILDRGFGTQLSAEDAAVLAGEIESAEGIEMDCGVYGKPLKGLVKKVKDPSRQKKNIRWASPIRKYSPDSSSISNSPSLNGVNVAKKNDRQDEQTTPTLSQEQYKKNKEIFKNAFGVMSNLDVNGTLAPFIMPDFQEAGKRKELEIDRGFSKIASLPLPDVSRIKAGSRISTTPQSSAPQASSSECEVVDMEVDSGSSARDEQPEPVAEPAPEETQEEAETSFVDPFNIDYDAMLLGSQANLVIDSDAETSTTDEKKTDISQGSEPLPKAESTEPRIEETKISPGPGNGWLDLARLLSKPAENPIIKQEMTGVDTPASPEPPASPQQAPSLPLLSNFAGLKQIMERLGKCPSSDDVTQGNKDIDLRPSTSKLVSEPKLIPLCQRVEFSVGSQKTVPLVKPALAAFQDDDDIQLIGAGTKDRDERLIPSNRDERRSGDRDERSRERDVRSRDRDDRDDRYRRNDRDRDRRDRDRRDDDYEKRRDRDFRREDRRNRDRDRSRDRGRDRSRDRDRDRNRYRDRNGDRDKRRSNSRDRGWRTSEDIPLPSTNINHNGPSKNVDENWNKERRRASQDDNIKVPSPVPKEALMFTNPLAGIGISDNVLSILKPGGTMPPNVSSLAAGQHDRPTDSPLSPPPPASPEHELNTSATLGAPTRFIKAIPVNKSDSMERVSREDEYANRIFPRNGPPISTPAIPAIPIARDETWRTPSRPPLNRPFIPSTPLPTPGVLLHPRLSGPPPVVPATPSFQPNARLLPPSVVQPYLVGRPTSGFPQQQQLPDAIIIMPDYLALKPQHTPTPKLRELLEKLIHYQNRTSKRAILHVHEHIAAYLREKANDRFPQIPTLQSECRQYLNTLLEYQEKGVVKFLPPHYCDRKVDGKLCEISCCGYVRSNPQSEGFTSAKVIFFSPIDEGTAQHRRMLQENVKIADARIIGNFETL